MQLLYQSNQSNTQRVANFGRRVTGEQEGVQAGRCGEVNELASVQSHPACDWFRVAEWRLV